MNIRKNMISSSKLIISLFQFSYWVPIPYDFIIWKRIIDNYNRYKFEHPPKYIVNCDHPLQIKFHRYFVVNYTNRQRRNAQRKNKFIYRSAPIKKIKLEIPKKIIEQCFQANQTQKYLYSLNKNPQHLIKYDLLQISIR
jgi:hypothetical protein